MKKIFKIALASVAVAFAGFGIYQNMPQEKTLSDFALENIEALTGYESPEVVITCGTSKTKGYCWDGDCVSEWTPLGWFVRTWDCHTFVGYMSSICLQDMPCDYFE